MAPMNPESDGEALPQDGLQKLIDLGIALSAEKDYNRLLEMILIEAKRLSHADGGTLYLRNDDDTLSFAIMRTDSLNIAMGGTTGKEIPFPPLRLFNEETGEANHKNVATHVALSGNVANIPDAYDSEEFDFSGTKKFDEGTGYRSKSFLTVPLKNHDGDVIGVLQLLNARNPETEEVIPFGRNVQPLIEALASQAAVALDNTQLIEGQKNLLDAFIRLIAHAIDRKSPYTGGHCERVPVITEMLATAACADKAGLYRDFDLTQEEWYELHIAAWLHDCGKVTTPEYVVDKATKLETIYDRIETVRTRFEVLKRDTEIDYLRKASQDGADSAALKQAYEAELAQIEDDQSFIETVNVGGEFLEDDKIERIKEIGRRTWRNPDGETTPFLSENEVYNLSIKRGTLTDEERQVINDHIVVTIDMLDQLPFPKNLKKVPEYAGGHHEKMDGTGYPRGLMGDQMSTPARMMAIADIYEALTAGDRPYKKAKKLSEAIKILSFMRNDAHVDPDLFDLFLTSGVFLDYAKRYLPDELIDIGMDDVTQYMSEKARSKLTQEQAAGAAD